MTPPGEYEDGSVGDPAARRPRAPQPDRRAPDRGALRRALPRRARRAADGGEHWLATGDIFVQRPSGHFEIVDRVKDVYKNTRGQTVAPAAVERRLSGRAGREAGLPGRGRPRPQRAADRARPRATARYRGALPEAVEAYFSQIVAVVNHEVAPYERVVRFALLERDFDPERELTPKGSYRRKEIERAFAPVIESLYRSDAVELACGAWRARLPRWFYPRPGSARDGHRRARARGCSSGAPAAMLAIGRRRRRPRARRRPAVPRSTGDVVDLGLFARQPLLWVGNPRAARLRAVQGRLGRPARARVAARAARSSGGRARRRTRRRRRRLRDSALEEAHELGGSRPARRGEAALAAVARDRGSGCRTRSRALGWLLRRRLESLAWHPDLERALPRLPHAAARRAAPGLRRAAGVVRAVGPALPHGRQHRRDRARAAGAAPARVAAPAAARLPPRPRLAGGAPRCARCSKTCSTLLARTARERPEHLVPVRAELATWALFDGGPAARREGPGAAGRSSPAGAARASTARGGPVRAARSRVRRARRRRSRRCSPTRASCVQSVALAFDEPDARAVEVAPDGAWVTPLASTRGHGLYRVSFDERRRQAPRPAARAARRRHRRRGRGDDAVDDRARRPARRARASCRASAARGPTSACSRPPTSAASASGSACAPGPGRRRPG